MNGPTAHGKTCETRTNEKAILEQKQNMTKLRIANKTDVAQMGQPNKAKLANTQNSQNSKARPGAKKQRMAKRRIANKTDMAKMGVWLPVSQVMRLFPRSPPVALVPAGGSRGTHDDSNDYFIQG